MRQPSGEDKNRSVSGGADLENNEPVRPPVAYTSDYKDDPIFGNRSRRFGRSETGAEWVEAETTLLGNNSGWTATPTGGFTFGNDLHYGGDPLTRTFGGVDNGDYVIRARILDRWGNQSPLFAYNLNVSLTAPRAATATPRVYDENDQIVINPATNQAYTEGFVPGLYMGITLTEVASATAALPSYLFVQRREFLREDGAEPNLTPVDLPRRVRMTQDGTYPLITDNGFEEGVQYEYRAVAVRNPGISTYGDWTP